MLQTLFRLSRVKILNTYRDLCRSYVRDRYNVTGDVCFVYSHDGENLFYMTDTTQGVCAPSDDSCRYIRKLCAENKLTEYGLPQPDQITPQLVLAPTLSMLKLLGPKRFFQFLRDWRGDSSVGDIVVMKYSVMI